MLGKQTQSCLLAKRSLSTRFALIGGRSRGAVRISVQAMAEMDMAPAANPPPFKMEVLEEGNVKPFARPLPLEPMQQTLSNIPLMVFYPALLAAVGVFGFTGLMAGKSMPVDTDTKDIAAYGTAALLAAGAAAVAVQAKKIRDSATIVDLYNQIVDLGDPTTLTSDIVAGVGSKYGINLQKEELDGLQRVYGEYLSCVIPKGDTQLMGDEPEKLIAFMTALGLTDEQAAPMHLEIGAKFYRDGFESKSRTLQNLNRRAFQRLVYVSSIMFGDQRASVLTPWGQNFKLTDAQLFVARRDNAKAIFKSQLEARGLGFPADRAFLQELREKQTQLKLMDESAEEVAKECSMAHVEVMLRRAMDCIKGTGKSRDAAGACAVLKEVLNYSRQLSALAGDESLIPGLGPVNIHGSVLLDPAHSKARELRELFKTFLDYYLTAAGEFTEELVADTKDMQAIMCIPARDASYLQDEVSAGLYKELLRAEVLSKRIDEAPATVLQALCQKVRFSPEAAMELHKELYKNKLKNVLEAKQVLSDADEADLARVRRILCLTNEVAQKGQLDVAGKKLGAVISAIYDLGINVVPEGELVRLDKTMKDLRLDKDVAVMVVKKVTIEKFRSYIKEVQKAAEAQDQNQCAQVMKNLVQFNALVVTPVLDKVKGTDAAKKELAEILMQAQQEAAKEDAAKAAKKEGKSDDKTAEAGGEAVPGVATEAEKASTLKSMQSAMKASRGEYTEEEKKAQKEISLKDAMEPDMKDKLYKQFLMITMQGGETKDLPLGGMETAKKKKKEETSKEGQMARLQQWSEILGMSQMEVASAHSTLAEDAYKQQAKEVMSSGPLNEEKNKYLESMQAQMGLTKETSEKVLKEVRIEVYGTSSPVMEDGSSWNLARIMQHRAEGKTLEGVVEEVTRRNLYRRELGQQVTDGTGEADSEFLLTKLPEALELDKKKIERVIKEMVGSRRRTLLVQAVSQVRQKRPVDAMVSLNNLISCNKVMPENGPMPWNEQQEINDVFQAYCGKVTDTNKQCTLQQLLGLSDDEANELRNASQTEEELRDENEVFF